MIRRCRRPSPSPPAPAEVRGTVEMRGECLVLVQEDAPGAPAYPVIWPAGTTWQEDPPAVVLEGGQAVELAQRDRPLQQGQRRPGHVIEQGHPLAIAVAPAPWNHRVVRLPKGRAWRPTLLEGSWHEPNAVDIGAALW